jgi:hypothetical protein
MVLRDPDLIGTVGVHIHSNCCTGPKSSTIDHPSHNEGKWKVCPLRGQDRSLLMQIICHFQAQVYLQILYAFLSLSAYQYPISPAAIFFFVYLYFYFIYWLHLYILYVLLYITFLITHCIYYLLFSLTVSLAALLFTPFRNSPS